MRRGLGIVVAAAAALVAAGCSAGPDRARAVPVASVHGHAVIEGSPEPGAIAGRARDAVSSRAHGHDHDHDDEGTPPTWAVGKHTIPPRPPGTPAGTPTPTPPALRDRRLPTPDVLPPPPGGGWQESISVIDPPTLARMGQSWRPGCPVPLEGLRIITVSTWGFDGKAHTGQALIATSEANAVVGAFKKIFEARFPIEDLRIFTDADLNAPNTGDGNLSGGFNCRKKVGGSSWSEHSYGMAIDINPFHNPYVKGGRTIPELAGAYVDRSWKRPGMLHEGDVAVRAFDAIGWRWGGRWTSPIDTMHFSKSGR